MKKITVKIKEELQQKTLKEADYVEIETIHNDDIQIGYVRYFEKGKRFHLIQISNEVFELHIDSLKKKHKVIHDKETLIKEAVRMKRINRPNDVVNKVIRKLIVYINKKKRREKRKFKDQYAPNLLELQRTHVTTLK